MSNLRADLQKLKSAAQSMPSPKGIAFVLDLVSKGEPYEKLFFDSLDDPSWLPVLDSCGYFSNLPGKKAGADGAHYYPFHLPLIGLTRLAAKEPQMVSTILAKLELPENPTISDQVLRCVASIREPTCIPILHPLLAKLGEGPSRSSWIWIQDLLNNWMKDKAYTDVFTVLSSYLIAAIDPSDESLSNRDEWTIQQVDKSTLEVLMPDFPMQVAIIAFNALVRRANRRKMDVNPNGRGPELVAEILRGGNYFSSFVVDDFNSASNYRSFDIILARRLYSVAVQIFRQKNVHQIQVLDQLLRSHSWELFNRLRWNIYSEFPELSLSFARRDVLERIPFLNRSDFLHRREFAQLLQAHADKNGSHFLSEKEISRFCKTVFSGPIDDSGDLVEDSSRNGFYIRQLWPILSLLRGKQVTRLKTLIGDSKVTLRIYPPARTSDVSGRFVKFVAPQGVENLGKLSDDQLWRYINDWQQTKKRPDAEEWWVREDFEELAKKFAELPENQPDRFLPKTKWWENLKRPEPLVAFLIRRHQRIQEKPGRPEQAPTADDWANCLGVARWIIGNSGKALKDKAIETTNQPVRNDWYSARRVVSDFLTAAIQFDSDAIDPHLGEIGEMLKTLIEEEDSGLCEFSNGQIDDWLTTAINTVRGQAMDGLLKLALRQRNLKKDVEPWIFDFIHSRLIYPEESPAIFALIGANLRLVVHLFSNNLKAVSNALFPSGRVVCRDAGIVAHFLYDYPMTAILEACPGFLEIAVDTLKSLQIQAAERDDRQKLKDFPTQLGVHICFYFWNGGDGRPSDDSILVGYFHVARAETRASVIRQIASIFEQSDRGQSKEEGDNIFGRVMRLWEWRYSEIEREIAQNPASSDIYQDELAAIFSWVSCECFPFEWRIEKAMAASCYIGKMPEMFIVLEKLHEWNTSNPERLILSLKLLAAILSRPNDQLRWQIQAQKLCPLLARGMHSGDGETKRLAIECQELFLKLGLFEFLDLTKAGLGSS